VNTGKFGMKNLETDSNKEAENIVRYIKDLNI